VDRFTTPGDRPFAVHDLGGLRVEMNICYGGGFPESIRAPALLGADLVVLPTNWPTGALGTVKHLVQARALGTHVNRLAVNRVGEDRGCRYLGLSRAIDYRGEIIAASAGGEEVILYAEVDPEKARAKRVGIVPGQHEVNRIADRLHRRQPPPQP
jgi:predicted amidohydrolase